MRVGFRPLAQIPAADHLRLAGPSFFASPGFLALWAAHGGRPGAWVAEDGARTVAMLPGVEYGAGAIARFASAPDDCYGGLRLDPAAEDRRAELAAALFAGVARRRYAKVWVFDFHRTLAGAPAGFATVAAETRLVDISAPGWTPPDRALCAQVRHAERSGVRVEPFDWDRHAGAFLALVRRTAALHGRRPRHAQAFYRALAALAGRDQRVVWRWCEHGGRPVASHIYFVECGTLQAWQSHHDRRFAALRPNPYIRFTLCRELARRGVGRLNIGATPAGADGLAAYKARWGGSLVRYPAYIRIGPLGRLADALAARRAAPRSLSPARDAC
jgi:CelD/BcsL family acetyltransferase involved in cellulose biosynthesis